MIIDYCPICGKGRRVGEVHTCPKRTLAGIDSANTAAINKELDTSPTKEPSWRTEAQRLNEGLKQLQQDNE